VWLGKVTDSDGGFEKVSVNSGLLHAYISHDELGFFRIFSTFVEIDDAVSLHRPICRIHVNAVGGFGYIMLVILSNIVRFRFDCCQ